MTEPAPKIFIVDDDPSARMVATFQMEGSDARIREFGDGDSCLAALDEGPDIVILDIEMPGTDGIAVCRGIRAAGLAETQIIFVSSHNDLETRLTAYDAGGNDYIIKPYDPEELARKIDVAKRAMEATRSGAMQARMAQQAAFAAMSSMGETGVTLEFLRASFACRTADELGLVLCNAIKQYDLKGLVELREGSQSHCYSTHGECTALETSIIAQVRDMDRIFQFRDRLVINYPRATVLIPNLPLDDPDRVGRLRDHLAVLAEGAEARFLVMINESRRIAQAESIIAAVADLTKALNEIEKNQEDQRIQALVIANTHMQALTGAFVHLGLTQGQEESLVALTQEVIDKIAHLQDYGASVSQRLREVTARLRDMTAGNM
ncbi:MAG: response regulator [Sterolibacterium sp.]|jgi:CheY-like chemotaxis protein